MFHRKDIVLAAVVGLLANAGFAWADKGPLSLDAATAVEPSGLLMTGLDKLGTSDPLKQADINIYGWIEGGYTFNARHHRTAEPLLPGPFNHQFGNGDRNHFMLNQLVLRFERQVKSDKFDVGGMIELMYGSDSNAIHANGFALGNDTYFGKGGSDFHFTGRGTDDRFNPQYQFDIVQAFIDVNVPIGNGLKLRAGKFVSLMGYETIDPRNNPFYSHSYIFSVLPFTFTGLVGFYNLNDQWALAGGVTRGWDQCLEDNNGSIDLLGQITYKPNQQWSAILKFTVGPENDRDSSHYRTAINAITTWQATEKLKLGLEALYVYDGGRNGYVTPTERNTHAYGDQWGAYLYSSYLINDHFTANARFGFLHSSVGNFIEYEKSFISIAGGKGPTSQGFGLGDINIWDLTLGVTVRPFPKDPIGKNLTIRPEVRYSFSEDRIYFESHGSFKDQLTFSADVIFSF
jgi:hypothetical protein